MNKKSNSHHVRKLKQAYQQAAIAPLKKNKTSSMPVTVRLTIEERAQLEKDAAGLSLSVHIRGCLFKKSGRRKHSPLKDAEALSQVLGQIGQADLAVSLKQLAHHAQNGTLQMDDETIAQLHQACEQIEEMRNLLIKALGLKEKSR